MKKLILFLMIIPKQYLFAQIKSSQKLYSTSELCNNYLFTPSQPSYVEIGKLNIAGNQLTIEATINRTTPYLNGTLYSGDVVSKHSNPTDVNYLLRSNEAEITTTNGFFRTPPICEIQLNSTYHIAMVYDGKSLKFYRNGFLMSQIAASGNLVQNNWETKIGYYEEQIINENFIGYINEVRIWNIVRTQKDLKLFISTSLPNPSAQNGLLAYYRFDDLLNKQGNFAWDGKLFGKATIKEINPNCIFVPDSCSISVKCIDSVRIMLGARTCSEFDFEGLQYPNTRFIKSWQWFFGDGMTSNMRNVFHSYSLPGNYNVKLIVTDSIGCTDSITKTLTASFINIAKSNDTIICKNSSVQLYATGGSSFVWNPSTYLSNDNISNPISINPTTITYYVTVTNNMGCSKTDSIHLTVRPPAVFSISPDQKVCTKDSKQLIARGGNDYLWYPTNFLNNPRIPNPVSIPDTTITYSVKIKSNTCNDSTILTTKLYVLPLPIVKASKNNDVSCSNNISQLKATGGKEYLWQPGKDLNDSTIPNPIAILYKKEFFTVLGTDINGCKNSDTLTVNYNTGLKKEYYMPTAFSPNNDGVNDCFGLKYWGVITKLDFSIYNRYGEKIFYSNNSEICWDGMYKGILQNIGVYTYIIKATTTCNEITKKGTFVLLR